MKKLPKLFFSLQNSSSCCISSSIYTKWFFYLFDVILNNFNIGNWIVYLLRNKWFCEGIIMFETLSKVFWHDFTVSLGQQWYSCFWGQLDVGTCTFLCTWTSGSLKADLMFLSSQRAVHSGSCPITDVSPSKPGVMLHVVYKETWMSCRAMLEGLKTLWNVAAACVP